MRAHIFLFLSIVISLPMLAQTGSDDSAAEAPTPDQSEMMLPPPVSNEAYATVAGAEKQSNYLRLGMTISGGYIRNLYPGTTGLDINEATYLLQPSFDFDRTGTRLHTAITYTPAFAWYQVPTVVNTADQHLNANAQMRLSPHVTLLANEDFDKMSTGFGQTTAAFQPTVSGSTQSLQPIVYGLFEPQLWNRSDAVLSWQFSRDDMVAGSGWISTRNFTNPAQSGGLYNSNGSGGAGSWTHRMSARQYAGGTYEYSFVQARPVVSTETGSSDSQLNGLFLFYTAYLTPHLSLSAEAGGQYFTITERMNNAKYGTWSPAGTGSLGWQGNHTAFAIRYGRLVAAGEGILDAYVVNSVTASGQWQMARTWSAGLHGSYFRLSNTATPALLQNAIDYGHTISGGATLGHKIGQFLQLSGSYDRIHQAYENIPSIRENPDSDRVLFSVSYALSRPIGQ